MLIQKFSLGVVRKLLILQICLCAIRCSANFMPVSERGYRALCYDVKNSNKRPDCQTFNWYPRLEPGKPEFSYNWDLSAIRTLVDEPRLNRPYDGNPYCTTPPLDVPKMYVNHGNYELAFNKSRIVACDPETSYSIRLVNMRWDGEYEGPHRDVRIYCNIVLSIVHELWECMKFEYHHLDHARTLSGHLLYFDGKDFGKEDFNTLDFQHAGSSMANKDTSFAIVVGIETKGCPPPEGDKWAIVTQPE